MARQPAGRRCFRRRTPHLAVASALSLLVVLLLHSLDLERGQVYTVGVAVRLDTPSFRTPLPTPSAAQTDDKLEPPSLETPPPTLLETTPPPALAAAQADDVHNLLPVTDSFSVPDDPVQQWDGNETNQFHLILAYPNGPLDAYLCTLESLLAVLDEAKSPSRVVVWVTGLGLPEYARGHPRVVERQFDFFDIIAETPLGQLYGTRDEPNNDLGKFGQQNKANAMRLAILYREGGFYLDSDFVVLRDPSTLGLGVGYEQKNYPNNAAMFFNKDSPVILHLMNMFVASYNGDKWGHNGPLLLMRFLRTCRRNGGKPPPLHVGGVLECAPVGSLGIWAKNATSQMLGRETERSIRQPFDSITAFKAGDEAVRMVHLWHSVTKKREGEVCKSSPAKYLSGFVGALRKQHCPLSTSRAMQECKF